MQNLYTFTTQQQDAYTKIRRWLREDNSMFLLAGYAGTGKTYLATVIANELSGRNRILLTAPTHKAAKVLRKFFNNPSKQVQCSTIHSALGLGQDIDGFGNVKYIPNNLTNCPATNYDILFIDEASMVDNELFDFINSLSIQNKGLKILFIGDPAQIPPVNHINSVVFNNTKIESVFMDEIVRQQKDNPIIDYATMIRSNIKNKDPFEYRIDYIQNKDDGVHFINDESALRILLDDLFNTSQFRADSDFAKVIAWTNKEVNLWNNEIRTLLYRLYKKVDKIMLDEKLIINDPILNKKRILFNTNDEVEVKEVRIFSEKISSEYTFKYYNVLVEKDYEWIGKSSNFIKVVHEDSEQEYNELVELFRLNALSERQGSEKAKVAWALYYQAKSHYANVLYNYAITAHKSQGSTYENTIVFENDILKNKNIEERNRILYTAVTRPIKKLYLYTR